LDAELEGGLYPYEFDHETYWRQLCAHAGVRGDGSRFVPEWKLQQDREKEQAEKVDPGPSEPKEEQDGVLRLEEAVVSASTAGQDKNVNINGHEVEDDAHVAVNEGGAHIQPFCSSTSAPVSLCANGAIDIVGQARTRFSWISLANRDRPGILVSTGQYSCFGVSRWRGCRRDVNSTYSSSSFVNVIHKSVNIDTDFFLPNLYPTTSTSRDGS
jgi:hypothetical protein